MTKPSLATEPAPAAMSSQELGQLDDYWRACN